LGSDVHSHRQMCKRCNTNSVDVTEWKHDDGIHSCVTFSNSVDVTEWKHDDGIHSCVTFSNSVDVTEWKHDDGIRSCGSFSMYLTDLCI